MYYHIIVETDEKDGKGRYAIRYEFDGTDLEEIKKLVVIPYKNGGHIYIDGRYIKRDQIRSLKLKMSEKKMDDLLRVAQSRVSPGVLLVYTKALVVANDNFVFDVTKKVLSSVGEILDFPAQLEVPIRDKPASRSELKNIFIVHGRDDFAKIETARFVEKLGFTAIILHEQASGGKTIIEKIESYTNVGFAIVLYTPCDVGGLYGQSDQRSRARQNVVFEHGFLIGKLGRDRVCALVKDAIETPNDISGVVYVPFDTFGAWRYQLARELRQAGYSVDLNSI